MNIEDIFTVDELALIDSGKYMPGRAVLDAKIDLAAAMEREACARVCDDMGVEWQKYVTTPSGTIAACADAIRARGNT
jgi:hypothetical protein